MKILFCSSEAVPFIRTGGLGDVAGALPKELKALGHDVRIVLPKYSLINKEILADAKFLGKCTVKLGWRKQYCGVLKAIKNDITYYLIDNLYYFDRNCLYGQYDDGERFAFFSKAILESINLIDFNPDIIHCNDWQTAMLPVFLKCFYKKYSNIKTVLTIHNIKFQGIFELYFAEDVLGLKKNQLDLIENNNQCNFLKGGIECSDVVNTVSNTYAKEITTKYYGFGLENFLKARANKLMGIVNGIDTEIFNPETDKSIFYNYNFEKLGRKRKNKMQLAEMLNFPFKKDWPLISVVSRLTEQKGMELLLDKIEDILKSDVQMVILGQGDWKYENLFLETAKKYPNKLKVIINFCDDLANKIYASSDLFLMPSQFEPCGLSQLIAMQYGTIPIVRETGGLKDTVCKVNLDTKSGTGFTFKKFDSYDMLRAIFNAINAYNDKELFLQIQKNIANVDFTWKVSAKKYEKMYKSIK